MAFGLMFFAVGVGVWLVQANPPLGGVRPPDPLLFHLHIPLPFRVLLWCGTGGAAIALARHARWQWIGFVALALAPVERVFSYAGALLLAIWPGGASGSVGTYLTMGVLFGAVLFVTRLIASWPDPPGDLTP